MRLHLYSLACHPIPTGHCFMDLARLSSLLPQSEMKDHISHWLIVIVWKKKNFTLFFILIWTAAYKSRRVDFPDTISIHKPSITCFSNLKEDFKLVGIDEDVVVVVEGISNTMVFMVVIPQILKKRKPYYTTKSGGISRHNKTGKCIQDKPSKNWE